MDNIELNQIQLDALREISSIGIGNAAVSLSSMLGQKVSMTVPAVRVESLEKMAQALGDAEKVINAIYFSVNGGISGTMLLLFPIRESLKIADILTVRNVGQTKDLDEMGLSALKEAGNIIAGTYLRAIGQTLNKKITYSVPGFTSDMLGAMMDGILARLSLKIHYDL